MTKGKHEKIMQDNVFGKAQSNEDGSKWVYIAEVKQEKPKSYFLDGKGKQPYKHKHDLGETFDNVREVNVFVWDTDIPSGIQYMETGATLRRNYQTTRHADHYLCLRRQRTCPGGLGRNISRYRHEDPPFCGRKTWHCRKIGQKWLILSSKNKLLITIDLFVSHWSESQKRSSI